MIESFQIFDDLADTVRHSKPKASVAKYLEKVVQKIELLRRQVDMVDNEVENGVE